MVAAERARVTGTLQQCLLVGNTADYNAGADSCDLVNCTVTGNTANSFAGGIGGGAYGDLRANLTNCIVYGNTAPTRPNYGDLCIFSYSCTAPLPTNGLGNITNEPVFVDWVVGNLRLQSNLPCINAGNSASAFSLTDLDGRSRIVGAAVDMGAYECQGPGMGEFIGWLQRYGFEVCEIPGPLHKRIRNIMSEMPRKRYSPEFKAQAVELVSLGKPVPEVAKDFGFGANLLYRWVRQASPAAPLGSAGLRAAGEEPAADERRRLRREIAQLRIENDILKKAAVILGTKPQLNDAQ